MNGFLIINKVYLIFIIVTFIEEKKKKYIKNVQL